MGTPQPGEPLRVLHCPGLVGGHAQQLARSERELGLDSWAVAFQPSPYQYASDEVLWPEGTGQLRRELKRWALLWRALRDFDVIHFNFGATITPQLTLTPGGRLRRWLKHCYAGLVELRDLPLLRGAGKGIVVTFQGDDARQGDRICRDADADMASEVEPGYYSPESDARKRWRIAQFARYADRIYALNPDLLRVLPPHARFLPYAHIDLHEWHPVDQKNRSAIPLVLHAPTHRGVKGTRFVLEAVERLRSEGVAFEFALVEGLSRAEARRLYERADLLIDQLLIGWYGGLAVELMALGKPVVCYIRPEDLCFVPEAMRQQLPILQASPSTLYRVLREWLTVRRAELSEVGRRSRAYVEKWHDPRTVAAELIEDYRLARRRAS